MRQKYAKIGPDRPPPNEWPNGPTWWVSSSPNWHIISILVGSMAFPHTMTPPWFLFPRLGCAINTQIEAREVEKILCSSGKPKCGATPGSAVAHLGHCTTFALWCCPWCHLAYMVRARNNAPLTALFGPIFQEQCLLQAS